MKIVSHNKLNCQSNVFNQRLSKKYHRHEIGEPMIRKTAADVLSWAFNRT